MIAGGKTDHLMRIKGLNQLHKHIPELNTPLGVLRVFFLPVILLLLVPFILDSRIIRWPVWTLIVEITFGTVGFILVYLFIHLKGNFIARFGSSSYSKAASWFGYPGVAIIAVVVARIGTIPGPEIPRFGLFILLPILGWVLIVIGGILSLRAVLTFGLDYLVMLYVYFPEESQLVNHKIYNILRHPAYAGLRCMAIGLALLNGNWYAYVCALIFALGLWAWVHWVEEKELIDRFGPSYIDYRQHVPAFFPHLNDLRGFFEFLILGR